MQLRMEESRDTMNDEEIELMREIRNNRSRQDDEWDENERERNWHET